MADPVPIVRTSATRKGPEEMTRSNQTYRNYCGNSEIQILFFVITDDLWYFIVACI